MLPTMRLTTSCHQLISFQLKHSLKAFAIYGKGSLTIKLHLSLLHHVRIGWKVGFLTMPKIGTDAWPLGLL